MNKLIENALINGGSTLKDYKEVTFKSGYQIAKNDTKKIELSCGWFEKIVMNEIKKRNGNCGLYLTQDKKYLCIETSELFQFDDDYIACKIGLERHQESILKWSTMECLYMADFKKRG